MSNLAVLSLLALLQLSVAVRLPFRREDVLHSSSSTNAVFADASNPFNFNVVDFSGDGQIIYVANITLDGQSYEVCIASLITTTCSV